MDLSAVSVSVGLQCAASIALPLAIGIGTGHDRAAGWGAVGAFLTDMAMDQPERRFRARVVAVAAVFVALGGFLGALSGIEGWVIYPLAGIWALASGLLAAVSARAALIGVSSATALLYAASFQISTAESARAGVWMLASGLGAAAIGWVVTALTSSRGPGTSGPGTSGPGTSGPGTSGPGTGDTGGELYGLPWARRAWATLRHNLRAGPAFVHHALRLATVTEAATVLYRLLSTTDGFWIPEAALFIGRPDAAATRRRSVLRVAGSAVGVTLTTLVLVALDPSPAGLAGISVVAGAVAFAVHRVNFGLYVVFVTVLFVLLTAFGGVPESHAVIQRLAFNVLGAALAVAALRLWPTPGVVPAPEPPPPVAPGPAPDQGS
ncbi:MAG TPA: FUSC family protein [Acidimicrobiales bacterium]|nr:FUSC family protein [Acidimicrobiales bacterium]